MSGRGEIGYVFTPFPEKGILDYISYHPIIQVFTVFLNWFDVTSKGLVLIEPKVSEWHFPTSLRSYIQHLLPILAGHKPEV